MRALSKAVSLSFLPGNLLPHIFDMTDATLGASFFFFDGVESSDQAERDLR